MKVEFGFVEACDRANADIDKYINSQINRMYSEVEAGIKTYMKENGMTTKTPIKPRDIREGDLIRVEHANNPESASEFRVLHDGISGHSGAHFLLDRLKKVVYAKGTTLYLKTGSNSITLSRDHFEGVKWFYSEPFDTPYRADYYTDVKPDPHPVGAIRWVTGDARSPYGYEFKKGDRVEVTDLRGSSLDGRYSLTVTPLSGDSRVGKFIDPKFLSATKVEPAPKTVTVPRDAVEKLRTTNDHLHDDAHNVSTGWRAYKRHEAIVEFLNVVDNGV